MKKNTYFLSLMAFLVIILLNGCDSLTSDSNPESSGVDAVLESILVTLEPNKSAYEKGETLDLTGLYVTGIYSDGTEEQITDYAEQPSEGTVCSDAGVTTITLVKGTKTTSFSVEIYSDIGDVYYIDGTAVGVVFQANPDRTSGKIVSVDETLLRYCTTSASVYGAGVPGNTSNNGITNRDLLVAMDDWGETMYPATYWCNNSAVRGTYMGGVSDWYLPTYVELAALFDSETNTAVNLGLSTLSGSTSIDAYNSSGTFTRRYLSSYTGGYESSIMTYYSGYSASLMNSPGYVRAVRYFE